MTQKEKKATGITVGKSTVMVALTSLGVCALQQNFQLLEHKAEAATATLSVVAKLVHALEITVSATLSFGTLAMTMEKTGRATIDPLLNQLNIEPNSSLTLAGGEPQAGRLLIRGADLPVSITIEDSNIKLTNGTETVSVNNINLFQPNGGTHGTITPAAPNYTATVAVGATINTRVGQGTGTYVGTTRVFANYQ